MVKSRLSLFLVGVRVFAKAVFVVISSDLLMHKNKLKMNLVRGQNTSAQFLECLSLRIV